MARLKLTKPGFETYTGVLLGAEFVNGVADHISLADVDAIAAAIGGDLINVDGDVIGPAGSHYRRTSSGIPDRPWPIAGGGQSYPNIPPVVTPEPEEPEEPEEGEDGDDDGDGEA